TASDHGDGSCPCLSAPYSKHFLLPSPAPRIGPAASGLKKDLPRRWRRFFGHLPFCAGAGSWSCSRYQPVPGGARPPAAAPRKTSAQIRCHTSSRWIGISPSASKPRRTCPGLMSRTVTLSMHLEPVELPTTTDSWLLLVKTNIVEPPFS